MVHVTGYVTDYMEVQVTRLKDVAGRAGVSTATTSRVLSGKGFVSDELKERVLAAVHDLNYSPDGIARSMSQKRTLTLGLVVSDVTNPFFTAVARGVEDTGQESGYSVVLCNTDEDLDKERAYLSILREKRVDGIILAVASDETDHIQRLVDAGTRIVLIDRLAPGLSLPSVQVDNRGGMERATQYLLHLGHSRIGIITGSPHVTSAIERMEGYRAAMEAAEVPIPAELVVAGRFTQEGGYEAGLHLWNLPRRPTAILSSNNVMTTGLLLALRECGARIPEDISIIGFDDLPYFGLLEHPLTVVSQPMYTLGRHACEMLIQQINAASPRPDGEHRVRLPAELVVRGSCRAPLRPSEQEGYEVLI